MSSGFRWSRPLVVGILVATVTAAALAIGNAVHQRRLAEPDTARQAMAEACDEARSLEADREPEITQYVEGQRLTRLGKESFERDDLTEAGRFFRDAAKACREAITPARGRLAEETREETLVARNEAAAAAGAKDLERFRQAAARLASGEEALESGRFEEARDILIGSRDEFRLAALEAPAGRARDEAVAAQSVSRAAGLDEADFSFSRGAELIKAGNEAFESGGFESALESFLSAKASFEQALTDLMALAPPGMVSLLAKAAAGEEKPDPLTPVSVVVGSTPDEIEAALTLCQSARSACAREWYESEIVREVEIAPYAIDRFEVTNEEFARFVKETGYRTTAEEKGYSYRRSGEGWTRAYGHSWQAPLGPESSYRTRLDHPVAAVSAYDAEAYCRWAGGRLPNTDEWEFAARGHQVRTFPWGSEWQPQRARWQNGDGEGTRPVGSFASGATPEGVHDLAGNVWEWTSTEVAGKRVLKGGSWMEDNPANLRGAVQRLEHPADPHVDDGFRCARDLGK